MTQRDKNQQRRLLVKFEKRTKQKLLYTFYVNTSKWFISWEGDVLHNDL